VLLTRSNGSTGTHGIVGKAPLIGLRSSFRYRLMILYECPDSMQSETVHLSSYGQVKNPMILDAAMPVLINSPLGCATEVAQQPDDWIGVALRNRYRLCNLYFLISHSRASYLLLTGTLVNQPATYTAAHAVICGELGKRLILSWSQRIQWE
jgi:hypothetical protein